MTLVIMAAGMGSRFGGFKQIEPVGPNGEFIIDYSIYDAYLAGFNKVVFIVNSKIRDDFEKTIGKRASKIVETYYVCQDDEKYLNGFSIPKERTKPLGTAHAILSTKDVVNENFAVINADDYYGREAFKLLYDFLSKSNDNSSIHHFCMVGYELAKTLTSNGHVARGICKVDKDDYLLEIVERTKIQKNNNKIQYTEDDKTWFDIDEKSIASLNCFGFSKSLLDEIEKEFPLFIENNKDNLIKAEFFLPTVVDTLMKNNLCDVKVLKTTSHWYGMTYREDLLKVREYLNSQHQNGFYKDKLF